ncbi:MAG TPA: hypothetical protein DCX06_01380 [Opitutae bacterium]|nr:hypothetical protein [Opitutae bacterium]
MIKLFLSISVCVALTSSLFSAPLANYIKSDVQAFVSIRNLAETQAQWESHPFAELLDDESMKSVIEALSGSGSASAENDAEGFVEVMQNEFGLSMDEFLNLFNGEIALSFYNLADQFGAAEAPRRMALMAHFSGDEDRIEELMQIQFERNAKAHKEVNPLVEHVWVEETFMGEVLYMDETFNGVDTYIEDGYALVDGVFVLATEDELRQIVEWIKEGGDSIASSESYQRAIEDAGRGDLRFYANLSAIVKPLNEALMAKVMQGGLAMFGVTAQSLDAALDLEALQACVLDVDLTEKGLLLSSGVFYREKSGLLRLLHYVEGALPEASYVPEAVLATSVSTFDFSAMFAELEKVLGLASPSVPMLLDIQFQKIKTDTGVDLRASILENISGDFVSLSMMREQSRETEVSLSEQLYVMGVKDTQSLSDAMETLKDLVPGARDLIETQEYEGQTIHTIKSQRNPMQPNVPVNDVSFVITRSELILNIGRVGLLQEVLSRMVDTKRGFWQLDETERIVDSIAAENAVSRSYVDFSQMAKPVLQSLLMAATAGGLDTEVDFSQLSADLEIPLIMISESNEADDGLLVRALLLKKEDAE